MRPRSAAAVFRRGAFAPVREEVTARDLPVTGLIPADLDGRYLRNGPNPLGMEHPRFHYYLGAGMIHGVRLRGGRAEWYRNRWVRQAPVTRALREERSSYTVLGGIDGPSNINVIGFAGRALSLGEGGTLPFELGERLETLGTVDFDGGLRNGLSAHPKIDPVTGDLHSLGYFSGSGHADYTVVSRQGQVQSSRRIELPHSPMMHDFALTPKHVVLYDLPAAFHLLAAASGDPFPFRWNDRAAARIGLLTRDRADLDVTWFDFDPVWIYHTVNAHDTAAGVVVDVVVHPSMFGREGGAIEGNGAPSLQRIVVDRGTGRATRSVLDDTPQEFPRIDERLVGRRNRFAYTAGPGALVESWRAGPRELDDLGDEAFGNVLFKHDLGSARTEVRRLGPDAAVGEAVFVPRRGGTGDEDDGYLLTYAHDPARGATDLVILAASDFTGAELARVHLPVRVPLGLHGNWLPDDDPMHPPSPTEGEPT